MMSIIKRITGVFVCFSLLSVLSASANAAWIIKQVETINNQAMETVMTLDKDAIRMDNKKMKSSTIINFTSKQMYMIQHANKFYMAMSLDAMKEQVKEELNETEKKATKPLLVIKETGEHQKIAGYDSEKIVVIRNGKETGEIWITKEIKDSEITKIYERFFEMSGGAGDDSQNDYIKGLTKAMKSGFPMKIKMNSSGMTIESEVKSITKKNVPKSTFQPPKNYNKANSPQMMMPPTGKPGKGKSGKGKPPFEMPNFGK